MEHYKRLLAYLRPYWWIVIVATIFSFFVSGITGAMAWYIKPLVDSVQTDKNVIKLYPFIYIGFFLSKGIFSFIHSYLMRIVGSRVVRDVRGLLFNKVLKLPMSFFVRKPSGEIISRILNDSNVLEGILGYSFKDIVVEGVTFIILMGVAFSRRWDLTLMALIIVPFSFFIIDKFGKKMKRISHKMQERAAELLIRVTESISGIKIIKAFLREDLHEKKFEKVNRSNYSIAIKAARTLEYSKLMHEIVMGLGMTAIMFYGLSLVYYGNITLGDFFSLFTAIGLMLTPIKRIGSANNNLQRARASAERIFYLLDQEQEEDGKIDIPDIERDIDFKNITFVYPRTTKKVLSNIDFHIKKGELIAIVGKSGAGKTTLVDMIPRFYRPTEGIISIDGVNINDATFTSLRRNIGIVSQDVILFNETVKENILLGRLEATDDEIIEAAKAAYAHDFIMEMPDGYDTLVGERGIRISGGQKQRLSIARALLKNPPILILDEATSSLDTASELVVQRALDNLMTNRTTFVIAHRLSTVVRADRILVIDNTKIAEIGTHQQLLDKGGLYKTLYESQFNKDAPAL